MEQKSKYEVHCRDEFNEKKTVLIMANDKVEAKERVLVNHPTYEVDSVLSEEDLKITEAK